MDKIYRQEDPVPAPEPPKPQEPAKYMWYEDPIVWVTIVSLVIAIVLLVMYYRKEKSYTF